VAMDDGREVVADDDEVYARVWTRPATEVDQRLPRRLLDPEGHRRWSPGPD
jgi:hypothetical protein